MPLQSFLFISLALFANGTAFPENRQWFFLGFAAVGAISAVVTLAGVWSAYTAMDQTDRKWKRLGIGVYGQNADYRNLPPLTGGKDGNLGPWLGKSVAIALPSVVVAFWLGVAVVTLTCIQNRSVTESLDQLIGDTCTVFFADNDRISWGQT